MRSILDAKVTFLHLLLVTDPVAMLVLASTAVAGSLSSNALQPGGSVRMAMAASTTSVDITGTDTPAVKVLSTSINVPFGKVADVQATFTASVHRFTGGAGYAYCFGT